MKPYKATDSARAFHESTAKIKAVWGPVGSGKSSAAFWEFIFQCMESDIALTGLVVRSSYRELMDTSRKTFFNWFGEIATWHEAEKKAVVRLPSADGKRELRHELLFRSIQKPQDTTKLQSLEVAFAFLEECVPSYQTSGIIGQGLPKAVFTIAMSRLRQEGAARYTLVCTANPPQPSHWYNTTFCSAEQAALAAMGASVVFQPPFENKPNLPVDYYEGLLRSMDEDMARRLVMGEIITAYDGERVYPEAVEGVHVVEGLLPAVEGFPLIMGFDWGLTPATLITQIVGGQWRWLRELQSFNKGAEAHLEDLRELLNDEFLAYDFRSWADPAGVQRSQTDEKTCFQIAAKHGFRMLPGKQDWQSRKESIKQRLTRMLGRAPALVVSQEGCPIAAEGLLGGYRYPRALSGEIGTRPIKNHFSHLLNAAEYIATREFTIEQRGLRTTPHDERDARRPPPLDPFRSNALPPALRTGTWMSSRSL